MSALVLALLGRLFDEVASERPWVPRSTTTTTAAAAASSSRGAGAAGGAPGGVAMVDAAGDLIENGDKSVSVGCFRGVVLDDASPFVGLFRELGLERVCDADWVRFEQASVSSVSSMSGDEGGGGGGGGGGGVGVVPFAAVALYP